MCPRTTQRIYQISQRSSQPICYTLMNGIVVTHLNPNIIRNIHRHHHNNHRFQCFHPSSDLFFYLHKKQTFLSQNTKTIKTLLNFAGTSNGSPLQRIQFQNLYKNSQYFILLFAETQKNISSLKGKISYQKHIFNLVTHRESTHQNKHFKPILGGQGRMRRR